MGLFWVIMRLSNSTESCRFEDLKKILLFYFMNDTGAVNHKNERYMK